MGLSALPESNVDGNSVYEDVGNNNNSNNDCVTIISVRPATPSSTSTPTPTPTRPPSGISTPTSSAVLESETSSDRGSFTINSIRRCHGQRCNCNNNNGCHEDPIYENLEFHRVKISVPGSNGKRGKKMLLHDVVTKGDHSVNSRVIKRQNRVAKKPPIGPQQQQQQQQLSHNVQSSAAASSHEAMKKKFEKFGYSKNEVWNWLYTDNEEENGTRTATTTIKDLYSVPDKNKKVNEEMQVEDVEAEDDDDGGQIEVKFSPYEFLGASNRLAHLDIDGFDNFVGNTLEKAIIKKRRQKQMEERTVTITEVPKHSSTLNVKHEQLTAATANNAANKNNNEKKSCHTCAVSGESSCSSALSSLESVRSSNNRSSSCGSSAASETLGSELKKSPPSSMHHQQQQQQQQQPPVKPLRSHHLVKTMASLNSPYGSITKQPYQTLEVSQTYFDNHNGESQLESMFFGLNGSQMIHRVVDHDLE